ncbi:ABC transporter ATP-binding protein [Xanthomonas melonis]|uniref:ABC transporter ATP-binding protein n=2 Tax=Xanthomonas TaxID=338 RepID=A0A8E4GGC4_9XANT|nr:MULTISPECIES: ABC transporter ATP-binding protein [Xanthomonas]SYZ55761.1 ABC transporter ATP-binding protein [Xanthomonas arboricola pv. juglandis]MCD0244461.1 ABC transporter ATP-binding protein [Xanthomonas melonis]MCD0256800.1 ABC transporter ATP-binding protein [Xanthomonas melonis]MCD0265062.1 ABC transporter ATP-binding protein [Xanthomonas melonis]CAD1792160.1 ABC transporter ATP-binding protein [Xanthomonas euroxanthea]
MLKLKNLSKCYTTGEVQTTAIDNISLEVNEGEFVAITGPSGCGKSTLLNVLGLLDLPDSGDYELNGESIGRPNEMRLNTLRRGRIGFIFQSFNLIEELTVFENVELALEYSGVPRAERRTRVTAMLERLGLDHRATHRPSQLSGGQQQRVAIARALVSRPSVLLADEPTGNLDSAHGEEVMALLKKINQEGTTLVMVTHSPQQAQQAGRCISLLDGKVIGDTVRQPTAEYA